MEMYMEMDDCEEEEVNGSIKNVCCNLDRL
jgi:hypothetical protein